jgi:peptide deformylase
MIITNNEELLRVKCEPVSLDEVGALIETLENELAYANRLGKGGIGLAAPQIGISKDIAIVRMGKISLNLVNARLDKGYDQAVFVEEGCLSFPGRLENTLRFQEVYITNNLVEPRTLIATGLVAVVCQHEMDHCNSTLFMDRIAPKSKPSVRIVKVGPNEMCSCGSGRKFKKCCGR